MLQVLFACNTIVSRRTLAYALFAFVAIANVATGNAKSVEALDFGENFVVASQSNQKLAHLTQYKCASCNNNNTGIYNHTSVQDVAKTEQLLTRRKRFLAFPVGSSFACTICLTTGVVGNPNYQYLSMGLNWGLAYDLPNSSWVLDHANALGRGKLNKDMEKPTIKRRYRRELYHKVETIINSMGYSGRDCVLRALCESRQYFTRNKMGMIGELLRVIFSLPKQRIFSRELRENADIAAYDHAYRKANSQDCVAQYDCPFSLLELAFGRYSTPSTDFYGESGM